MTECKPPQSMEPWLARVRARFEASAPELLPLFEAYANEAIFGRGYLADELGRLKLGACVLEVGAGAMLLSCQLVREGYQVTALEPTGSGFSHFDKMREIIMEAARNEDCLPLVLSIPGEAFDARQAYDLAFSVNVMEHVDNVEKVISNVSASLKSGASYRFTCPNYLFPYEPHFGIPTLFSKRLTERFMKESILHSNRMEDAEGLWRSLNWITVPQIRRHIRQMADCAVRFDGTLLASTLERVLSDPLFSSRHSQAIRIVAASIVRLRIHRLLARFPAACQPIIDCIITKK